MNRRSKHSCGEPTRTVELIAFTGALKFDSQSIAFRGQLVIFLKEPAKRLRGLFVLHQPIAPPTPDHAISALGNEGLYDLPVFC